MAFLIIAGFLIDIAEAQVMPPGASLTASRCVSGCMDTCPDDSRELVLPTDHSQEARVFFLLDMIITAIFVLELLLNLFANR